MFTIGGAFVSPILVSVGYLLKKRKILNFRTLFLCQFRMHWRWGTVIGVIYTYFGFSVYNLVFHTWYYYIRKLSIFTSHFDLPGMEILRYSQIKQQLLIVVKS